MSTSGSASGIGFCGSGSGASGDANESGGWENGASGFGSAGWENGASGFGSGASGCESGFWWVGLLAAEGSREPEVGSAKEF